LFKADKGVTYQEGASSIDHKKEGLCDLANNGKKRGLTGDGLIEVINALARLAS
jgi:hypothetical protein